MNHSNDSLFPYNQGESGAGEAAPLIGCVDGEALDVFGLAGHGG